MPANQGLLDLVVRLQRETELLCLRGLRALSDEQRRWFTGARDQLGQMGAEFLSQKIAAFLACLDNNDRLGAARLLDLLTTLRVFERVLTLRHAKAALRSIQEVDAS